MLSFSIDVSIAQEDETPPPADNSYPTDGSLEERRDWLVDNLNKFDPKDESQRKAFAQAYKDKKIVLSNPEHEEAVVAYLSNYKEGIPLEDRDMLKEFVSHYLQDPTIGVDLKEGEGILLSKEGEKIYLISSDGKKHDIKEYSSYKVSGQKLDKIISRDDGTIDLVYGDVTIHLKDTTLTQDEQGNFILNDGSILGLNSQSGRITIDGSNNKISCDGTNFCSFSIGKANIELDSGGTFTLGDNKYSIVKGKATIGKNWCKGSCEFGLNADQTEFTYAILRNYLKKFARTDYKEDLFFSALHLEGGKYGDANIRNSESEKDVFVCLDCDNLPSKDDSQYDLYSGFVHYEESERKFYSRGILRIKVGENTYWDGSDENVVVSLSRPIYDGVNTPRSLFSFENCNGCEYSTEGKDVGTLIVNDQYSIFRYKDYADGLNKPRPALIRIEGRGIKRITSQLVELMDAPFTLAHKDLYGPIDTYNTQRYNSDTLLGRQSGGRSIQKYFNLDQYKDYAKSFFDEIRKRSESGYQHPSEVVIIDKQAFNLDKDGNVHRFLNMYRVDRKGGHTATLLELLNTGDFQRIVEKIDPLQLEEYNIISLILHGVIDKNKGFDSGEEGYLTDFNDMIRGIFGSSPIKEAQRLLPIYEERKLASLLLEMMILEDERFENLYQIYLASEDDEYIGKLLEPLLKEPSNLLEINKGIIKDAQKDPEATHASILYYDENGNVAARQVLKEDALAVATDDAIIDYERYQDKTEECELDRENCRGNIEYYLNPEINTKHQGEFLLSQLVSDADKQAMQALIEDFKKGIGIGRKRDQIDILDPYSEEAEGYTELELVFINSLPGHPKISELVKNRELNAEDLNRLKELYDTQRGNEALESLKSGVTSYLTPKDAASALFRLAEVGTLAWGGGVLTLKGARVIGKLSKFVPRPRYLKYFRGSPNLQKVLRGKYDDLIRESGFLVGCGTGALTGTAKVTGALTRRDEVGAELCGASDEVATIVGREPVHLRVRNTQAVTTGTLTGQIGGGVVQKSIRISPETLRNMEKAATNEIRMERKWLGIGRQMATELERGGNKLFPNGLVYQKSIELADGKTAHIFQQFGAKATDISGRATRELISNYILLTPKPARTAAGYTAATRRMTSQLVGDYNYLKRLGGFDDVLPVPMAGVELTGDGITNGILYQIKPGAYKGQWKGLQGPAILKRFPEDQQGRIAEILDRLTERIVD